MRQGYLPCTAAAAFSCNTSTGLAFVGVSPAVQPYLNLYPLSYGPSIGGGAAEYLSDPVQPSTQNSFLGRLDYNISAKDSVMLRYNTSKSEQTVPQAVNYIDLINTSFDNFAAAEWKRIISPTTLNSLRFGFSRGDGFEHSVLADGQPFNKALDFIPGAPFMGTIGFSIAGGGGGGGGAAITGIGANIVQPERISALNQWEVNEQIFHQAGAHAIHAGVAFQRIQQNITLASFTYGDYSFATLPNFLQGIPALFEGAVAPGVDGEKGYRHWYVAPYIQDDYKVAHNFTLNLGLRYEMLTVPTEVNNLLSNFVPSLVNGNLIMASVPTTGKPYYHGSHNDFAPRAGFAWDVFGNGKTAIRGGAGIYFDQVETFYNEQLSQNVPYFDLVAIRNPPPPFPLGFSAGAAGALPAVDGVTPYLKVPTRLQYSFSIQQQLSANMVLTVGYVGAHAYHLTDVTDGNRALPTIVPAGTPGCTASPCYYYPPGSLPADPNLGPAQLILSNGDETYQGLQVNLLRRLASGFMGKFSFTYSSNIDDTSNIDSAFGPGTPISPMVSQNISIDRSLSDYDQKFTAVGNFTYALPFDRLFRGAPQKLVGGWQIGTITTLSTGMPFTAQVGFNQADDDERNISDRPNFVAGCNPVQGGVIQYFNPKCFTLPTAGFYGNAGRNTLTGPGLANLDVSLQKSIAIKERMTLLFRTDAFNITNHADFDLPSASIFSAANTTPPGTYSVTAGRITATSNPPRQIQFSVRLSF